MQFKRILVIFISILTFTSSFAVENDSVSEHVSKVFEIALEDITPVPYGLSDQINAQINETIAKLGALIGDIPFDELDLRPGNLEVGNIEFIFKDGQFTGFGGMIGEIVDFSVPKLSLQNLTIYWNHIEMVGNYTAGGFMVFPIGNQQIDLSGSGGMKLTVDNLRISVSVKFFFDLATCGIAAKDLVMQASSTNISMHFDNFMNDDELSWAMNEVFNDVGIVCFDYYKGNILNALSEPITKALTAIIKALLHSDGCSQYQEEELKTNNV